MQNIKCLVFKITTKRAFQLKMIIYIRKFPSKVYCASKNASLCNTIPSCTRLASTSLEYTSTFNHKNHLLVKIKNKDFYIVNFLYQLVFLPSFINIVPILPLLYCHYHAQINFAACNFSVNKKNCA